ncbi:MAG: NAD(P)H-dependent glycerol-3-phosphate dehydrogenase [Candidatus Kapabacteria bacterium]|nr:NAD(P)H-dependent glycerol-3-phosphate dehydrogenase [Candidatus Kapabacteria bacterium]
MLSNQKKQISVIGAGGWGTALAKLLIENGHNVILWSFESEVADEINSKHSNSNYLKNITLPSELYATTNLNEVLNNDLLLLAIPTQFIVDTISKADTDLNKKIIVNVAKGIEKNSLKRISEILKDNFNVQPDSYVIMTGPSHAEEVARKIPTTVVAASENYLTAKEIQSIFSNSYFRVYSSDDVIGCELGGAVKNVIAIAAGIIDGLGLGDNTKAALITRGLAEMSRLGIALGANAQTFSGLSGLGDLIVTCNSRFSRNRYVGEQIGRGKSFEEVVSEMKMIAEGVFTTQSAYDLGMKHGVELPIVEQVHKILFENVKPSDAINDLMTRKTKREWWW